MLGNLQYLFSSSGTVMEEVEDSKVYSVEVSLRTLNYGRYVLRVPPSVQSCWIYSVFVEKANLPLKSSPRPHFNLENINNLMSDTKGLSTKAEQFKTLFDTFQNSGPLNVPLSMATGPSLLTGNSEDKSSNLSMLKFYIDQKFKDLEEKVMKKLDESEKVQPAKLDKILSLLDMKDIS